MPSVTERISTCLSAHPNFDLHTSALPTDEDAYRSLLTFLPQHAGTDYERCVDIVLLAPSLLLQIEGFRLLFLYAPQPWKNLVPNQNYKTWCFDNYDAIMHRHTPTKGS